VQDSLGLIEVTGLSLAITVADAMAKTASVRLLGVERTIGSGWILVKLSGDVAAVRTALAAGEDMAKAENGFISCTTIARPAIGTGEMVTASLRSPVAVQRHDDGHAEESATKPAAAARKEMPAQTAPERAQETELVSAPAAPEPALDVEPVAMPTAPEPALDVEPVAMPTTPEPAPKVEPAPAVTAAPERAPEVEPVSTPAALEPAPNVEPAPAVTAAPERAPETEPVMATARGFTDAPTLLAPAATTTAKTKTVTCKLCGDPLCGRHKGESRSKCIHFQKAVLR